MEIEQTPLPLSARRPLPAIAAAGAGPIAVLHAVRLVSLPPLPCLCHAAGGVGVGVGVAVPPPRLRGPSAGDHAPPHAAPPHAPWPAG